MPAVAEYNSDVNGLFVDLKIALPPQTENLKFIYGSIRDDKQYINHVTNKINQLNLAIFQWRRDFHGLLMNYNLIDLKTVQGKLDKLNKEREEIIYNLRVLEGNGHSTGFDPKNYALH